MMAATTRPNMQSSSRVNSLPNTKSFSRFETPSVTEPPPPSPLPPPARSRASTMQSSNSSNIRFLTSSPDEEREDIFSKEPIEDDAPESSSTQLKAPQNFEELPIEIKSLTERFLESLSAKVHPAPLSIDALSDMFQDFYRKADSHIATHIAALSSRLSREKPAGSAKAGKRDRSDSGDQQMLTVTEISHRKKARRLLETKRIALEEAVERAVCEKVYDRLWRHRSTMDEEKDQKLRSRVAALSLVGIGLKELLVSGSDDIPDEIQRKTVEEQDKIRDSLSEARISIENMTKERYPLGKLHHLNSAHKSIVETLSKLFPATSSADEILPTLIYTLITSPPQSVNVISDLYFIQRFRASSKVDGEAAYCLVNLEAAVTFLETVELPSLRADEALQGPEKTVSVPGTPRKEAAPMQLGIAPASDPSISSEPFPAIAPNIAGVTDMGIANLRPSPTPSPGPAAPRSPRRLSSLLQKQTNRLEAAGDSLRDAVLDSADQALDTINSTLENSFRFLFGRIREKQQSVSEGATDVPLPKTLEDARKLVSTPPLSSGDDDMSTSSMSLSAEKQGEVEDPLSDSSSHAQVQQSLGSNKVLDLVGGRRTVRDRSVDSARSSSSGGGSTARRVAFFEGTKVPPPLHGLTPFDNDISMPLVEEPTSDHTSVPTLAPTSAPAFVPPPALSPQSGPGSAAVESMRSLGNTLNPLNQFAKIGFFGRTTSSSNVSGSPHPIATGLGLGLTTAATPAPVVHRPGLSTSEAQTLAAVEDLKQLQPPSKRFLECNDAKDLKLGEVEELLAEFKRLAVAMDNMVSQ